jgi:hypothetical protein
VGVDNFVILCVFVFVYCCLCSRWVLIILSYCVSLFLFTVVCSGCVLIFLSYCVSLFLFTVVCVVGGC